MQISRKARYYWPMLMVLFLTDCTTKNLIVESMSENPAPRKVVDDVVRFTLAHNSGMAYSVHLEPYLGAAARPVIIAMMLVMVLFLVRLYRDANSQSRVAGIALGLASGGALGNLYDRLRFSAGVVDFIDVGIGTHRFWVFNVADAGVSIGGVMLALLLWREGQRAKAEIS